MSKEKEKPVSSFLAIVRHRHGQDDFGRPDNRETLLRITSPHGIKTVRDDWELTVAELDELTETGDDDGEEPLFWVIERVQALGHTVEFVATDLELEI